MTTTANVAKIVAPAKEKTEVVAMDSAVGAAFIASGIGSTVLGLAIIGAEASAGIKDALNLWNPAGPLSGKTTVAVIAFLVSWVLLHLGMKNRSVNLSTSFIVSLVLIGIGLLLSFPPIFELFAAE